MRGQQEEGGLRSPSPCQPRKTLSLWNRSQDRKRFLWIFPWIEFQEEVCGERERSRVRERAGSGVRVGVGVEGREEGAWWPVGKGVAEGE